MKSNARFWIHATLKINTAIENQDGYTAGNFIKYTSS